MSLKIKLTMTWGGDEDVKKVNGCLKSEFSDGERYEC